MELKIPPLLLVVIFAIVMRVISAIASVAALQLDAAAPLSILLFVFGFAITFSGARSFGIAKTTKNPMQPETATQLVHSGIYNFTRNPMYLGLLIILTAWAIRLQNPLNLAMLIVFVVYMTKFQIIPEERALTKLFPEEYEPYKSRVRRWI